MKLRVRPAAHLEGVVNVPPSKSLTHRAVILASLANGLSRIENPLFSADTVASMDACRKIGANIKLVEDDKVLEITGVSGVPKPPKEKINVENSGTTMRIMTPVASLCNQKVVLTGDESIQKRPMQPQLDALDQLGVETSSNNGNPPVSVKGPIKGGICRIRGDISSQFISGLLIACPLAAQDTEIMLSTPLKSRPYVELTLDLLARFGGDIDKTGVYHVPGRQIYRAVEYSVESDYSSAALIMAAAAITDSNVTVTGLPRESRQGDRRIVDIFRQMDASIHVDDDSVSIRGGSGLDGIDIDLSDNPDLVPAVAAAAVYARGKTIIRNVEHLRYKECDRLKALSSELAKMGAKIKEGRDFLEIHGVESLKGAHVDGRQDHRIVMALAVAALRAAGETVIDGAESIPVSFPGFPEAVKSLNADMDLID
jgi:3-phosphoshikimate 1-carboxyvinyltransferase